MWLSYKKVNNGEKMKKNILQYLEQTANQPIAILLDKSVACLVAFYGRNLAIFIGKSSIYKSISAIEM